MSFAKEIALQKDSENLWIYILRSNMKSLGEQWLVELYDFKCNPTFLVNGFKTAGITNCLNA